MRRLSLALSAMALLLLFASAPSVAVAQGQGIFTESGYELGLVANVRRFSYLKSEFIRKAKKARSSRKSTAFVLQAFGT